MATLEVHGLHSFGDHELVDLTSDPHPKATKVQVLHAHGKIQLSDIPCEAVAPREVDGLNPYGETGEHELINNTCDRGKKGRWTGKGE